MKTIKKFASDHLDKIIILVVILCFALPLGAFAFTIYAFTGAVSEKINEFNNQYQKKIEKAVHTKSDEISIYDVDTKELRSFRVSRISIEGKNYKILEDTRRLHGHPISFSIIPE